MVVDAPDVQLQASVVGRDMVGTGGNTMTITRAETTLASGAGEASPRGADFGMTAYHSTGQVVGPQVFHGMALQGGFPQQALHGVPGQLPSGTQPHTTSLPGPGMPADVPQGAEVQHGTNLYLGFGGAMPNSNAMQLYRQLCSLALDPHHNSPLDSEYANDTNGWPTPTSDVLPRVTGHALPVPNA